MKFHYVIFFAVDGWVCQLRIAITAFKLLSNFGIALKL